LTWKKRKVRKHGEREEVKKREWAGEGKERLTI